MTADQFFARQEMQDDLYELVNDLPLKMMAGTKQQHDRVVINLIVAVGGKLRGKSCRPATQDTAIETSASQIRRPDVSIDSGIYDPGFYSAKNPRAVFEVLSRTTKGLEQVKKLDEYQSIFTLTHIVLIDPDYPEVIAYQRDTNQL